MAQPTNKYIKSGTIPNRRKSLNLYPPGPHTIKCVWYPIGDMNPAVLATSTVIANGLKLTLIPSASPTAIGYIKAAAALLLINSVMIRVII